MTKMIGDRVCFWTTDDLSLWNRTFLADFIKLIQGSYLICSVFALSYIRCYSAKEPHSIHKWVIVHLFKNVSNYQIQHYSQNIHCSKMSLRLLFRIGRFVHSGTCLVKNKIFLNNFYAKLAVNCFSLSKRAFIDPERQYICMCMYVCTFCKLFHIRNDVRITWMSLSAQNPI